MYEIKQCFCLNLCLYVCIFHQYVFKFNITRDREYEMITNVLGKPNVILGNVGWCKLPFIQYRETLVRNSEKKHLTLQ